MVELVDREADLGAVRLGGALAEVGVQGLLEHLGLLGEQGAQGGQLVQPPGERPGPAGGELGPQSGDH